MAAGACTHDGCACERFRVPPAQRPNRACLTCNHPREDHVPAGGPPVWLLGRQFWQSLGLILLGLLVVLLYFSGRSNAKHAADAAADAATAKAIAVGERTARITQKKAEITGNYNACVRSIPTLRNASLFLESVTGLAQDLVANAKRNHAATPRSNPQWAAQVVNIKRLEDRVVATRRLRFPVPTKEQCGEARDAALLALEQASEPDLPLPRNPAA